MLGVACSGSSPDAVKEPAVDLAATVEAAVEATRSAEREIRTPGADGHSRADGDPSPYGDS